MSFVLDANRLDMRLSHRLTHCFWWDWRESKATPPDVEYKDLQRRLL